MAYPATNAYISTHAVKRGQKIKDLSQRHKATGVILLKLLFKLETKRQGAVHG